MHTGEKPYQCKTCLKKFCHSSDLKMHEFSHSDEKKFQCDNCDKWFKSPRDLVRHKAIHMEERFECKTCDKTFSTKDYLSLHVRKHEFENANKTRWLRNSNIHHQLVTYSFFSKPFSIVSVHPVPEARTGLFFPEIWLDQLSP